MNGAAAVIRTMILLPLILALVGCGADRGTIEADVADSRNENAVSAIDDERLPETPLAESSVSTAAESDAVPSAVEKVVWEWLDANIGSQERLAASRSGQRLSGANLGDEMQLSSAKNLLFAEQLNLLYEIRKSKNLAIAKQYLLVHTLMTIDQAEYSQSVLPPNDPRRGGVRQQIATARQLLAAVGYEKHLDADSGLRADK